MNLEEIPLFSALSKKGQQSLRVHAKLLTIRAGGLIMRRGARPKQVFIVAHGTVCVQPIGNPSRSLGKGEVLGEMSVVSGGAVSATITAETTVQLWTLQGSDFLELIKTEPTLSLELLAAMAQRLRKNEEARALPSTHQIILVEEPAQQDVAANLISGLHSALKTYVPKACCKRISNWEEARHAMENWRNSSVESALLLGVPSPCIQGLLDSLISQDALLLHSGTDDFRGGNLSCSADIGKYRLDSDGRPPACASWAFEVATAELMQVATGIIPSRETTPKLSRLGRWLARKEIGIALGAGAARGFAHLGVLAELEVIGLPIDRISGTSMGGIAGLLYALGGNGVDGIELARQTLGVKGAARMRWLPRSSLLSDRVLRRRAVAVARGQNFSDLPLPVSVVATDLLRGQPVVIDHGSVADGFFSTSAVPGILPPVFAGEDTLVDGGVVARNPLEQLPPSRCGLRIAVNVIPSPFDESQGAKESAALRTRIQRLFGFREVLVRSWNHLGWIHSARDAARADILLEPCTRGYSGVDFATSWAPMVEAGRVAVKQHESELRFALAELFESVS